MTAVPGLGERHGPRSFPPLGSPVAVLLGSATRILAIQRPFYFIIMSGGNMDVFSFLVETPLPWQGTEDLKRTTLIVDQHHNVFSSQEKPESKLRIE